ncbi:hypothetical protein BLNAU_9151 [Blattamonas nauphoetae]|uniref:Uncharacterized protein n=1 Tax=Blattamonas nauphoetae TaxID=2049346 RepID=A0ABQ9XWE0_9EUKA|nr:hypothetical protein BLNAU_9151 [Blattamonas nauphoetae]
MLPRPIPPLSDSITISPDPRNTMFSTFFPPCQLQSHSFRVWERVAGDGGEEDEPVSEQLFNVMFDVSATRVNTDNPSDVNERLSSAMFTKAAFCFGIVRTFTIIPNQLKKTSDSVDSIPNQASQSTESEEDDVDRMGEEEDDVDRMGEEEDDVDRMGEEEDDVDRMGEEEDDVDRMGEEEDDVDRMGEEEVGERAYYEGASL